MFKTEEQINSRLSSEKNLANRFVKSTDQFDPARVTVPDVNDPLAPAQSDSEQSSRAQSIPVQEISELIPELEKTTKPQNVTITELKQPGNKLGKKKLTLAQRNEIAVRTRLGETQIALSKEFNVSQNTVSNIERGRTIVDERTVNERLDDVQDVAMSKLLSSLGYITVDKMEACSAVQASVVALNMGKIIGNIRRQDDNGPKVVVQIYAPELKKESSYKAIDV